MNKKLAERLNIAESRRILPLGVTKLNKKDIDYHRWHLETVYCGMLREASVIDDCVRLFEQTFKRKDFFIISFNSPRGAE